MAVQTVEFRAASGATLTAKLFVVGSDTVVQTASAVVESGNRKGTYASLFTDVAAGEYELIAFSGAIPVCRWFVTLTLTTATFQAYDGPAKIAAITHTGARIPNVTLVDTTTTNTDMRGTDNAALASNWTATRAGYLDSVLLAANSNRTVQVTGSNHVAAVVHDVEPAAIPEDAFVDNAISARAIATDAVNEIQNGLARADALATLTAYVDTEVAAIKTVTDRISTGLVADGAVWQFTANMLELAPAGGGGGGSGDATLANQVLILDQLDVIQNKTDLISGASGITSLLAGAVLDPGSITSFPEVLTVGDSYTEANGRAIQIPIVDTNGVPISSTGSLYFSSATVTFVIKRAGETDSDRIISGTATFVDPPGTGTGDEAPYAVIELLSSETSKGLMKYKYTGILTFTWPGTSDEVMSFETNTITFRE